MGILPAGPGAPPYPAPPCSPGSTTVCSTRCAPAGHTPSPRGARQGPGLIGEYGGCLVRDRARFGAARSATVARSGSSRALWGRSRSASTSPSSLSFGRQRPVLEGLPPLGGAPSSLSFPSAHATSSFAVRHGDDADRPEAAVLFAARRGDRRLPPLPRMHYPSDVLAGAVARGRARGSRLADSASSREVAVS